MSDQENIPYTLTDTHGVYKRQDDKFFVNDAQFQGSLTFLVTLSKIQGSFIQLFLSLVDGKYRVFYTVDHGTPVIVGESDHKELMMQTFDLLKDSYQKLINELESDTTQDGVKNVEGS